MTQFTLGNRRSGTLRRDFRRGATALGTVVLATPFLSRRAFAEPTEITMLAWYGHAEPDVVAEFEAEHNVKFKPKYYTGGDNMLGLIAQSPPGTFDIILSDAEYVQQLNAAGYIEKLDPADYPFDEFFPEFQQFSGHWSDGALYSVFTHSQSEAFSMADRVVIMSRSVIEQIGPPQEIYRTPRTRFVAEFLGSSNIFAGRVTDTAGDELTIETSIGVLRAPRSEAKPLSVGDSATFAVSDDLVHLDEKRPEGDVNVLQATIVGEEFVGATATIYLEAADGLELRAQKSHDELEHLSIRIGEKMFVSWRPEAGHVLPGE
jgi:hypothetical protein